jgi:protocatechuate 3,4-dioxygenase beta subunit
MVLRGLGTALVAAPLAPLLGCEAGSGADDAGTLDDAGTDAAAGGPDTADAGADTATSGWATGGTAAMRDKASYPNPFAGVVTTACALTCSATVGPCYSAQAEEIQDISYGHVGLPTRLYFQVLNEACEPLVGAVVDVWHVSAAGKYSGNDPVNEQVAYCTGNDPDYTSHVYFRGKQTTDANGVVFFDTCYPGWYSGRTVHIHFTVRVAGTAYVTSQLVFDDTLNDDILGSQTLYNSRGTRNTTNQNDGVIGTSAVAAYTFQTQRMTDGALLAWKTIVVRLSTDEALCTIPGGGGGGMGGPDGGGMGPGGMP